MKKKILLLMVLAVAFTCLLMISVSASDRTTISYTDINGATHSVPVVKYNDATAEVVASAIKSGDSRTHHCYVNQTKMIMDNGAYVILMDSNGGLTAYPTWYILDITSESGKPEVYEIGYGYLNSKSAETGKTYTDGATRYVEFPEGLLKIRNNGVWGTKPSSTPYETNVTDFVLPSTITEIAKESFYRMPCLKNVYIKPGNKITQIESTTFSYSTLQYIQFENLTELESIDGFTETNLIGDLNLSKTKLKSIAKTCFQNNQNIRKITLPDTLETIGEGAFQGCTNAYFASPYLPKNLKTVGKHFMSGCKNINETFIFPEGVTEIPGEMFNGASRPNGKGTINVVFLGKMTHLKMDGSDPRGWADEVNVYLAQNTLSDVTASIYSFTDKAAGTLGTSVSQTGTLVIDVSGGAPSTTTKIDSNFNLRFLFCGTDGKVEVSYCIATDGSRFTEDRGNFVMKDHIHYTATNPTCTNAPLCIVCDEEQIVPHTKGDLVMISYPNGYANAGDTTYFCLVCTSNYVEEETAEEIYSAIGYSYKLDGSGAIIGGYKINQTALDKWKTYNGSDNDTLIFGVIILGSKAISEGTTEIIDASGKLTLKQHAIQVETSSAYQYSIINFRVEGFNSTNYSSLDLIFAGYIYEQGKIDTWSYVQTNYEGVQITPIVNTYEIGGKDLYSVSAEKIDALDGKLEGIANS